MNAPFERAIAAMYQPVGQQHRRVPANPPDSTMYHVVGYSGTGDDFGATNIASMTNLEDAKARAHIAYHYRKCYDFVTVEFDNERDFEFEEAYRVGETEDPS